MKIMNAITNLKIQLEHALLEPQYNKTNKMSSAPRKDSDQSSHPHSLISLLCAQCEAKDPRFLHVDSED